MEKRTVDLNLYQNGYNDMEQKLAEMETAWSARTEYFKQIGLVRECIADLQLARAPEFEHRDEEAIYHRTFWPRFYGKLFFYVLAQKFCFDRQIAPGESIGELLDKGQQRISRFFSRHRRFWGDYLYGAGCFSEQFTRSYSRGEVLEPLSMLLDAAGGTMAGYWVAWGLAYEEFRGWLRGVEESVSTAGGGIYEWKESKSAAAELIKSQVEAGSIHINGKPATAAQLRGDFEQRFRVDLKDFDNLLYAMDTLKLEETPYLGKLKQVFTAWKKRLGK